LAKINTEYRKLKNQARFVMEIIENKLVVSKKKKPVLVAELRKRDYEAFPKVTEAQKAGETDDVVDNEEEVAADEDSGARDFDYLLGVSNILCLTLITLLTPRSYQSGLLLKSVLTS
jgi:DNA topoisomerase-2